MIGNVSTVLDLGCGDGSFMQSLSYNSGWKITGIDAEEGYLKKARARKIYKEIIKADILNILKKFIKQKKKFDLVFCSQVIEHLDKNKGEQLLNLVEKVAKKKIFISTPNGFMKQPEVYLDNNPYQIHRSGWLSKDFKLKGYKVYGVGFIPIWSEHGVAQKNYRLFLPFSYILSYLLSPIVYFCPSLGSGLFCIKIIR